MRSTLDQQIKEQKMMKQERLKEIKRLDSIILQNAKAEIEQEKQKNDLKKKKVLEQKIDRER